MFKTYMTTLKLIERRNALTLAGPVTPRERPPVRLNALRQGFRARTVVLSGENPYNDLTAEPRPKPPSRSLPVPFP